MTKHPGRCNISVGLKCSRCDGADLNGTFILSLGMMLRTAMYKVFVSDQKRGGRFACLRIHLLWTFICLTRFSMYPCMVCRYGSTGLNAMLCLRLALARNDLQSAWQSLKKMYENESAPLEAMIDRLQAGN